LQALHKYSRKVYSLLHDKAYFECRGSSDHLISSILGQGRLVLSLKHAQQLKMDAQKQRGQSKNNVDRIGDTEHRKDLTAYTVSAGYQIDSQQHVGNGSEHTACLDAHDSVAARNHLGLSTGSTKPEALPSSPIVHDLLCASTNNAMHPGMLIPSSKHFPDNMRSALKFAVSNPPVTTTTLIELDLNWILHNIHLRSDINFENDLHFMPVRGKRAEQKHKEAQKYWLALAAELQIHLHTRLASLLSDQDENDCVLESFEPRLPQMFADLRELLETLVPDRDHASIAGNLDVPFLMQQIENGVLDICQLAQWLTTLLKRHCAPIRDEWADQMTQQIEDGARRSDMILLVKGIERLFSVLEAMKLVVLLTGSL
jgi:T-complex protein 11